MGNSCNKGSLSKEDLDFLADKTTFTRRQIKKWHKGFMRDCPCGELSRNKFMDIYQALFPDGKAGPFYEHVFRTFDEDGSGKIDFKEFLQAISITTSGKPEEKLELAFRLYDIDRNGTIEEHEMAEIIKAIYLMTEPDQEKIGETPVVRTRDIFCKMDENNDGVISRQEFVKGCLNDETLFKLLSGTSSEDTTNNTV